MLSRLVVGSLLAVTAAHAEPVDDIVESEPDEKAPGHRVEGVLGTGGAAARYSVVGDHLYLDVQAFGTWGEEGAAAKLGLARFEAFAIEHELVAGIGYVNASGDETAVESDTLSNAPMIQRNPYAGRLRGTRRFLSAYINDTVRFIRGIEVTTGLVVEEWENLGGNSTITYGSGPPMDDETPDFGSFFSPTLSVTGHVNERLSVVAQTHRGVREVGPSFSAGGVTWQARAFTSEELGSGVASEASIQPFAPIIATVGYARTASLRRASASVTYTDPRFVGLTARIDSERQLDAVAVRRIVGGFAGFVGVEDALGERYVSVGVRGLFAR